MPAFHYGDEIFVTATYDGPYVPGNDIGVQALYFKEGKAVGFGQGSIDFGDVTEPGVTRPTAFDSAAGNIYDFDAVRLHYSGRGLYALINQN